MKLTYLSINGREDLKNVELVRPVFFWKAEEGCRQFTVELSDRSDFSRILFLRDTDRNYHVYDSVPLKAEKKYYLRVRCGLGDWKQIEFCTKKEE